MSFLTVTPLNSIKSKDINTVATFRTEDDIILAVPQETIKPDFVYIDIDKPLLSKIKCEWYYKKYPIYLADKDEILLTKLAIKQTRKDLKSIIRKINQVEMTNNRVVPKVYYSLLEKKFNSLALNLIRLKKGFIELSSQFTELERKLEFDVITTRDRLFSENERLKAKLTPRPNWSKCTNHFSGGAPRWQYLMHTLRSNELVDIMLNEFIGGNDGTNEKHILQHQGKTYENMKLHKRDVLLLVHEILTEKAQYDKEQGVKRETLKHFIYMFFYKKFQSKNLASKWYCNLVDALERFNYDENVGFFQAVLNGKIDEDIYHYFKKVANDLFILCKNYISNLNDTSSVNTDQQEANEIQLDLNRNTSSSANSIHSFVKYKNQFEFRKQSLRITKNNFLSALKQQFPDMNSNDTRCLINAAKTDLINNARKLKIKQKYNSNLIDDLFEEFDIFDFNVLFQVNEDGIMTEFLMGLEDYLNKERNSYVMRILNEFVAVKGLLLTENIIKYANFEDRPVMPINEPTEVIIEETLKPPKVKKSKRKKLKRSIKSKLSLLKKKRKKQKSSKTIIKAKNIEKAKEASTVYKSKSIDSLTSYDIDIRDYQLYSKVITVDELKAVVANADTDISILEIQRYIDWVFRSENGFKLSEIRFGRLIRELQKLNCYSHNQASKI